MRHQLGLYEKSMPAELTLAERLAAVRNAGFDHLDMSVDETEERQARLAWSAAERAEVRRAVEATGTPISTLCLSGHRRWPLGSHDPAKRERAGRMFHDAVDLACYLGVRIVQLAGYDVWY